MYNFAIIEVTFVSNRSFEELREAYKSYMLILSRQGWSPISEGTGLVEVTLYCEEVPEIPEPFKARLLQGDKVPDVVMAKQMKELGIIDDAAGW